MPDLEVGLESGGVDAVVIATPHGDHAGAVRRSLEAGKHVLCEKPLAIRSEEARALATLADERRLKLATGLNHRFYPPVRDALALVSHWSIGRVESVRAEIGHLASPEFLKSWHTEVARSGGGTLMDNGPHACDLIRRFLGEVVLAKGFVRQDVQLPAGCETEAHGLFRNHDDAVAELHASWKLRSGYLTVEVRGSEGHLRVETAPWRLTGQLADGRRIDRRYLADRVAERVHRAPVRLRAVDRPRDGGVRLGLRGPAPPRRHRLGRLPGHRDDPGDLPVRPDRRRGPPQAAPGPPALRRPPAGDPRPGTPTMTPRRPADPDLPRDRGRATPSPRPRPPGSPRRSTPSARRASARWTSATGSTRGRPEVEKGFALAFDDGLRSILGVADRLAREAIPATVFLVAGRIGSDNAWPGQPGGIPRAGLLGRSDLEALARLGFRFGSHGLSHARLDRLSPGATGRGVDPFTRPDRADDGRALPAPRLSLRVVRPRGPVGRRPPV